MNTAAGQEPTERPAENWLSACHDAEVIGDLSHAWYEISPNNPGGTLMRSGLCSKCAELQNFTKR